MISMKLWAQVSAIIVMHVIWVASFAGLHLSFCRLRYEKQEEPGNEAMCGRPCVCVCVCVMYIRVCVFVYRSVYDYYVHMYVSMVGVYACQCVCLCICM